jgi:hypothetical protein
LTFAHLVLPRTFFFLKPFLHFTFAAGGTAAGGLDGVGSGDGLSAFVIVKLRTAGVGSPLPAASMAPTSKLWGPSVKEVRVFGLGQGVAGPESTLHWKLEPGSLDENAKLGVGSVVGPLGPESIVVSGGMLSTVKLRVAGVWSTLPAASAARTSKRWFPWESRPKDFAEVHG